MATLRFTGLRLLVACALGAAAGPGCVEKRTQIVVGVATDMPAPDLLDRVRLTVLRDGVTTQQESWTITGLPAQPFELPGSFGVFSDDGSEPRIEIVLEGDRA